MTLRQAGFLRKNSGTLHLTIDGSKTTIDDKDIPAILAGEERSLYYKGKSVGKVWLHRRQKYPPRIMIRLHSLMYIIRIEAFTAVWMDRLKYAKIAERVPDFWQGFNQEVTA